MTTGKLGFHVKPWPSPSVHDPSLVRWLLRTQSYILSTVNYYFLFLIIYFLEASKKCILAYTSDSKQSKAKHVTRFCVIKQSTTKFDSKHSLCIIRYLSENYFL